MFENISTMSLFLKGIKIQNFKCFKDPQEINFKKLTLITGANSSGKSSIIYSILGALQSRDFPFLFSTNGKYVNMGDFKEISHNHLKENIIKIDFHFIDNNDKEELHISTEWIENKINDLPQLQEVVLKRGGTFFELRKKLDYYLLNFEYNPLEDPENKNEVAEMIKAVNETIIKTFEKSRNNKQEINTIEKEKIKSFLNSRFSPLKKRRIKIKNLDELKNTISRYEHLRLKDTPSIMNGIFKEFEHTSNFISSFRLHPDRTYLEKSIDQFKIGKFGEGYLDQIISWEDKKSIELQKLISIMKKLKLFYSIKPKRIGGGRYEVSLKTKSRGVNSALTDVGFGISQFLPIIVADLQLPENSTLFVSQPEIHLHPNAQANFGDYLTENVRPSQKNNKGKNYIIETHSEYLLNRIRLAIVKGDLNSDDLAVYFVENENNISKIHTINFTKSGEIENAPQNFFDTYYTDIKDIALNSF